MKGPTAASQKKVNAENLLGLGAERLAEILVSVAEPRVDLKRRLRMELTAQQGHRRHGFQERQYRVVVGAVDHGEVGIRRIE
ncbi:MAG TPA: hypothetical protein VGI95_03445 [Caulobacteraceae bacterium]|jgi:hypothetical protein